MSTEDLLARMDQLIRYWNMTYKDDEYAQGRADGMVEAFELVKELVASS